ncbi:MAG: hypothetical protein KDE47_31075, partial [Caldilineaceae bacterium]|nr:hypothetical protein [Caldilineaceae bacterium]
MRNAIINNRIISVSALVSILLCVIISRLPTTLFAQTSETWVHNGDFEERLRYWRSLENATTTNGRTGQGVKVDYDSGNSDIFQELSSTFLAGKTYQ